MVLKKVPHSKIALTPEEATTAPTFVVTQNYEYSGEDDENQSEWTFASSFLYSLSLITTMGKTRWFKQYQTEFVGLMALPNSVRRQYYSVLTDRFTSRFLVSNF